MGSILKWFIPLGVFVVGMVLLLLSTLFYGDINTNMVSLQSATSAYSSNYFGFSAITGSSRIVLFTMGLLLVLIDVGIVWLRMRKAVR